MSNEFALTKLLLQQGGKPAGKVINDAMKGDSTALTVVQENPQQALSVLNDFQAVGLSAKGASDSLDFILGVVPDENAAREMLRDYIGEKKRAELLAGRSDLPSNAVWLATKEDIIGAIAHDIGEVIKDRVLEDSFIFFVIAGWAYKLLDHPDYQDILDAEIGHHTIRQHLLRYCHIQSRGNITPDQLENLGIDFYEGMAEYHRLSDQGGFKDIKLQQVQAVKVDLGKRRQALQEEEALEEDSADEAKASTDDLAEELDI